VYSTFSFSSFDFPVIHERAYQKSCIVGRPTSYIILPTPDSEFIPLKAHTILVLSGYTYFLLKHVLLFLLRLLLLLYLAFEHGVVWWDALHCTERGRCSWGSAGGVLVGVAFVLLRWERRIKTGLDRTGSRGEESI
jgi:hypothetical protein